MNKTRFVFSIAVAALLVATPAMGQLQNFPDLALPAGEAGADAAISFGAGWGRGLNDASGKLNLIGAGGAVAMETVSFGVSGGYISNASGDDTDGEVALAGNIAYHLPVDASVNLSIQTGIGWTQFDFITASVTRLNIPVGVVVSGSTEAGSATVNLWGMPRVQFSRFSGDALAESSTDTDFGGSAGVEVVMESGFGIGVAGDLLVEDDGAGGSSSALGFGAYVFYALP